MKGIQKIVVMSLVISILNMFTLTPVFSEIQNKDVSKPKHPPQGWISKEMEIPKQKSWMSGNKWWIVFGLAAIIGGTAAALSGGEDNGDSSSSEDNSDTGSYSVTW